MLDLDNFKSLNDRYGHVAGDRILVAVADVLKTQVHPGDILVRYGGDEFAVLLPTVGLTQAKHIAERVRQTVRQTRISTSNGAGTIPVTVSIGVAELKSGEGLEALLHAADDALYNAKKAGRDAVSS